MSRPGCKDVIHTVRMADCAAQACVKRKRVILSRAPDHSQITAPTIVPAATDEHTGHSSWSATWRFTHRGENEARNGDQGAERSQGHEDQARGETSGDRGEIAALDGDQSTEKIRGNGRRSSMAGRSRSRRKDHGESGRHGLGDQAGRMPCELVICLGRENGGCFRHQVLVKRA